MDADVDMNAFVQTLASRLGCDADPASILQWLDSAEALGKTVVKGLIEHPTKNVEKDIFEEAAKDADREVATDVLRVPRRIEEKVLLFMKAWALLPPLVRAATASHLAIHTYDLIKGFEGREREAVIAMPRRAEVTRRFVIAFAELRLLMVNLANAADEEAVAAGIDADVAMGVLASKGR